MSDQSLPSGSTDAGEIVSALLTMAGLTVFEEEKAALVAGFSANRAAADALYDVADARYELPALTWSSVI